MPANALVYCVPQDASQLERSISTRIIDGNLLPEVGAAGRETTAQEIYKKMMGIKVTEHHITVEETDLPVPEPPVDVNTPVVERYKTQVAKEAASGIAQAIVEATTKLTKAESKPETKPKATKVARPKL